MKFRWLLITVLLCVSVSWAGMEIKTTGVSDNEVSLSVELTDGTSCGMYVLLLSIGNASNGQLSYDQAVFPLVYDFPGKVVEGVSTDKVIRMSAAQLASPAPTEGVLVQDITLTFASGSPIEVTLTALAEGTKIDGAMLNEDTVMASVYVVPHASGDTHHLTFTVTEGSGSVVPEDGGRYATGEVVQLSAVPAAGYRVAGWSGADNKWMRQTNTVTMTKDRKVKVEFELLPEDLIGKALFKADKKRTDGIADSFIITGQLGMTQDMLLEADSFNVTINGAQQPLSWTVPFTDSGFKMNSRETGFIYKGEGLKLAKVDIAKGKLTLYGKYVDLTGLKAPVELSLTCGEYNAVYSLDETVLNGTKLMPVNYLLGNTDYLAIYKKSVKTSSKTGLTNAKILGSLALDEAVDTTAALPLSITVSWGDFTETIPAGEAAFKFSKGKYTYKRPKELADTHFISYAYFDLAKGVYYVKISGAQLQTESPVSFGIKIDNEGTVLLDESVSAL